MSRRVRLAALAALLIPACGDSPFYEAITAAANMSEGTGSTIGEDGPPPTTGATDGPSTKLGMCGRTARCFGAAGY